MRKIFYLFFLLLFVFLFTAPEGVYTISISHILPPQVKKEVAPRRITLPHRRLPLNKGPQATTGARNSHHLRQLPPLILPRKKENIQKFRKEMSRIRQRVVERQKILKLKRQQFEEHLKEIRDKRKVEIISRIEKRLSTLNQRLVSRLESVSQKMLSIADKLEERVAKLKEKGQDVTELQSKITQFRQDVQSFQLKLEDQKGKAYVPTLEEGKPLGQSVKLAVVSFVSDFKNMRQEVFKLRKELVDILRLFRSQSQARVTPQASESGGLKEVK